MRSASEHLDKRFSALRKLASVARPQRGWVRAIREALGMTTAQLAKRLDVSQPRIVKLEKAEMDGSVTLKSLEHAAEALGCRFVYVLIPEKPLTETLRERASQSAAQQLAAVEHSMRLEDQAVHDPSARNRRHRALTDELLKRPTRLWD